MRVHELGMLHPEFLHEQNPSFMTRLAAGKGFCFALGDDICVGYALAHPWDESIPALHQPLAMPPPAATTLYIHDLVVEEEFQNTGRATAMVTLWKTLTPFGSLQLVSVNGTERFWTKQGFTRLDTRDSLASYGVDAVAMRWGPVVTSS